ncbi:MAG: hypothetical protein JSS34_05060 [Proteobacteria bacterium]|nr:hypothetical protein [Pseudomonadota bacterium]
MKKNFLIPLSLLFCISSGEIFSADETNLSNTVVKDISTMGSAKLSEVKTEELSIIGPLNFKKLSVTHTGTITGPVEGTDGIFENLVVTGPLGFENLTVQKEAVITGPVTGSKGYFADLTVSGPFKVSEILCQNLTVSGPIDATKLAVRDKTTATGNMTANNSDFGDMTITANKILFNETTARDLLIKKNSSIESSFLAWFGDNSDEKPQELRLTNKSVIEGDVTFESGKGKIYVEEGSQIKGKIQGGTVQKN